MGNHRFEDLGESFALASGQLKLPPTSGKFSAFRLLLFPYALLAVRWYVTA